VQGELGFGRSEQGAVIATFFAFAAISSKFAGRVADRINPAFAVRSSLFMTLGSCVGIFFFAGSWPFLCSFMALAGVGNGLVGPAIARILVNNVPLRRQGFGFGIKQASVTFATLLGGLAIPVVALTVGWRFAFVGAGALCLILIVVPDRIVAANKGDATKSSILRSERLPRSGLHLITLAFGLGMAGATALAAFAADAMVEVGIGAGEAGSMLAIGSLAAIGVRLWGGWIIDRGRIDPLQLVMIFLAAGGGSFGLLSAGTIWTTSIGVVLAGTFSWGWSGLMVFAVVDLHRYQPASASGVAQSGAAFGAVCGPLLLGFVAEGMSYQACWLIASVVSLVASILIARARKISSNPL
jgi:predicted MFS family arabinose efflux permease